MDWPQEPVLPSDEVVDSVAIAVSLSEETGIEPTSVVSETVAKRGGLTKGRRASAAAPVVDETAQRAPDSPYIAKSALARFVGDYVKAMRSNNITRQLKFYADNVDYYHNGKIDRRIIEQTLRRYHTRWPRRGYRIGSDIQFSRVNKRGEIVLTFPISFTLSDGRRTVKGATSNRLVISAATLDPRINAISEKRIRR